MSVENRMDTWNDRWNQGATHWHNDDLHFALQNYSSKLLPKPKCRVFVPLCGKTVDLEWLYREGHTVVGVEGVEQGILEFFTDHSLSYNTEELTWAKVFKTGDDRLKIYCCDIFKMDMESLGKFDAVWDRGSLVAIYEEDRERYAEVIKALLAPEFQYLLDIVQYSPSGCFSGPPRNIPTELVEKLFGDVGKLQVLGTYPRLTEDLAPSWGLESLTDLLLLITPQM